MLNAKIIARTSTEYEAVEAVMYGSTFRTDMQQQRRKQNCKTCFTSTQGRRANFPPP